MESEGKEIKPSYYEVQNTHTETLKEVLKYLKGRYVPLGPLVDRNISLSCLDRKHLIFQKISVCGRYQCQKKLHTAFNEVTSKYRYRL
jgi:hypothetical protein